MSAVKPISVLLVDDDQDDYVIIKNLLAKLANQPFALDWVQDYEAGLQAINSGKHHVYLVDYRLGAETGLDLLKAANLQDKLEPFIILTGAGDEDIERRAMRLGTADYLVKGTFDGELLSRVIRHSLQRKEMEQQRINQLMLVNKSKDEFIALASHQLRTPATGVKQYIGMLLEGYAGPLNEEQQMLLESAYSSNERQLHIVNDILRVAQVDLEKVKLNQQQIDLVQLIKDIIDEQQVAFSSRSQNVNYTPPKQPIMAAIDSHHFRMALGNIIGNAAKYTPDGKSITINAEHTPSQIIITIADQGVGIAKEDQEKLFQKFSRIDNPLSVQAGGSGLGLYLAQKIVEQHGGEIHVNSKVNQGTTFTINLPAQLAESKSH